MLLPYLILVSCKISKSNSLSFNAGNDPNFKIIQNTDEHFKNFNRKTEVFGLNVFAVPEVKDSILLHVSNVLAQYLDNDEDGTPDNQLVMDSLLSSNASMVIWFEEKDLRRLDPPDNTICQDVGNKPFEETGFGSGISFTSNFFLVSKQYNSCVICFFDFENCFECRVGTDSVILPISADHASVKTDISCLTCGYDFQFRAY